MNDGTHIVDEASLLVTPLKQHALVKIAETLIRPDLEKIRFFYSSVSYKPSQRFSDRIKQLCIPKSCQNDIRSTISSLYRHLHNGAIRRAHSFTPSTVKFNARGDVDVQRTFEDYMQHICRSPRSPQQYLMYEFLRDSCRFHQEKCVHVMLCELAEWKGSELGPFLRNAKPEVEVVKHGKLYCEISFVIKDLVDPAPWKSFVAMLNKNLNGIMFCFHENILKISTKEFLWRDDMALLWPKMTTIVKYEYAAEIFKVALNQSDTCLLIETMHYLDLTNRMPLIKANLMSFILCFLTHQYYRHILPDLQLVEEDKEVMFECDACSNFTSMLMTLENVEDCTNFSDYLVQLWNYFAVRDKSLGDRVHIKIRWFLHFQTDLSAWFDNEYEKDDAKKALTKLREVFDPDLLRGGEKKKFIDLGLYHQILDFADLLKD